LSPVAAPVYLDDDIDAHCGNARVAGALIVG
jgi:hypothetical protein